MEQVLSKQLQKWHQQSKYQLIINAINDLPNEQLNYELKGHLARAYNNADFYEKAIEVLQSVKEEGAQDSLWHFRLGYAYYYGGKKAESQRYFERAYELDPSDEMALQFSKMAGSYVSENEKQSSTQQSAKQLSVENHTDLLPFTWVEHATSFSVILNVGSYKADVFSQRSDDGFEGNGYDWGSLAKVFLQEKLPELSEVVKFDPEGSMFCAYSSDSGALLRFASAFKAACEDEELIRDLFSRAELD
jgi:tetratricopeptide (TPR) repeat protein